VGRTQRLQCLKPHEGQLLQGGGSSAAVLRRETTEPAAAPVDQPSRRKVPTGRGDGLTYLSGETLQPLVCVTNICHQVTGELFAGRLDGTRRLDASYSPEPIVAVRCRGAPLATIPEQCMQLIDWPGPLDSEVGALLISNPAPW
jgi:hypothetical protein